MISRFLGYWNLYERIWLISFCAIAAAVSLATGSDLFGFVIFLSGVLCVVLVAKGSIYNYPVGLINTLGYAWLAWQNGLFGEVGLNLLFYVPMNIIGFFMWKSYMNKGVVVMRRLTSRSLLIIIALCIFSILVFGFWLSTLEGQNTPYIDAATNVLSIAATLLMLRRYREQWGAYITLNMLSVLMWSVRATAGGAESALMVVMWSAYLVNSFYGWHNWSKGAERERAGKAA